MTLIEFIKEYPDEASCKTKFKQYREQVGIARHQVRNGNKVAFRIFPFVKEEVRRTGIEFLHKEPVKLNIDNHIVELGNTEETVYENIETKNFIYLSSQYKEDMEKIMDI